MGFVLVYSKGGESRREGLFLLLPHYLFYSLHVNAPGRKASADSLPEASTCDRRLSLPDYPSATQLKRKLLAAITHGCVGYDRV